MPQSLLKQQDMKNRDDQAVRVFFSVSPSLRFLFVYPSRSLGARAGAEDLWGEVYDIRLCISDSMMLIIRLRAKRRGEEAEIKRYAGSRTETEMDGGGERE